MKIVSKTRLLSIVTLTATSLFFTSCGEKKDTEAEAGTEAQEVEAEAPKQDTIDSLTDELIVQLNAFADTMISAKDTAAAMTAAANLSTISDAIADIASRMDQLETPDEDERTRIHKKMTDAGLAVEKKLMENMESIMTNQQLTEIIGPPLMEFQEKMQAHSEVFKRFGSGEEAAADHVTAGQAPAEEAAAQEAPAEDAPAEEAPAEEAAAPAAE